MSLKGKTLFITGASRGIGRAIAAALHEAGATLALCASREEPRPPAGARAFSARCDVSDAAAVAGFFAELSARLGPPEVLVLNAGVLERGPLPDFTEAQWDRVLAVNLKGAFLCARAAWPAMVRRGHGRIVAIGSISGTLGTPGSAAYNASKWGLTGLMKSLAEEGRPQGIFCATVLPAGVATDMLRQTPFEPRLEAAEVARVVRFLAAEAPASMTGGALEMFG